MGRTSDARERLIAATIHLLWVESYGAVTVDALCEQAQVKKGSFYHFFRSKDELVVAALYAHWESRRPVLDRLFSATVPPLERLASYFENLYKRQVQLRTEKGRVVGCLVTSVGVQCGSRQQPEIAAAVQDILDRYLKYYQSALRDAQAAGDINVRNVPEKARSLFAFMEGVLSQARIQDDPDLIRHLGSGALRFLGVEDVKHPQAVPGR